MSHLTRHAFVGLLLGLVGWVMVWLPGLAEPAPTLLPIALWWGLLALLAGLTLPWIWPIRSLPPVEASSPAGAWRGIRLIPTLLVLGWTIACLR